MSDILTSRKWWWVLVDKRGRLVTDSLCNGIGWQPALYAAKSDALGDAVIVKRDGVDVTPKRINIEVGDE